jgi:hypothetical protein
MVEGAKPLPYVSYNDGETTRVGIVLEDLGGQNLKLFVLNESGGSVVDKDGEGVPRREPEDYGPEGGGVTWYSPRE